MNNAKRPSWRPNWICAGGDSGVVCGRPSGQGERSGVKPERASGDRGRSGRLSPTARQTREPRRADAPRPDRDPAPDGFGFLRLDYDVSGEAPKACARFSAPLDPDAAYEDFVRLTPPGGAVFEAAGETLCIVGLDFAETRSVVLRKGLPAGDGEALAREERFEISFSDKPAHVGFAGAGVILPREDADGLALETINVSALKIEIWRVSDRNLAHKAIVAGASTAPGAYAYTPGSEDGAYDGAPVFESELDIDGARNVLTQTVFPLGSVLSDARAGRVFCQIDRRHAGGRSTPRKRLAVDRAHGPGLDDLSRRIGSGCVCPQFGRRQGARRRGSHPDC